MFTAPHASPQTRKATPHLPLLRETLSWRRSRQWIAGAALLLALSVPHADAQTDTWTGTAGDGSWNTATNWDQNIVPDGSSTIYDVVNPTTQTITLDHTTGIVGSDGSLYDLINSFNTMGNLDFTGGTLVDQGSYTLNGTTTSILGEADLGFTSSQTLSNGSFVMGDASSTGHFAVFNNATLTFDNTLSVTGASFQITGVGNLVNNTLLSSSQGGAWYVQAGGTITNNATIQADGVSGAAGSATSNSIDVGYLSNSLTNTGTIQAINGGFVTIDPNNYAGLGTVIANGTDPSGSIASLVSLGGGTLTLTPTDSLSTQNGGVIELTTTLDNTGTTAGTNNVFDANTGAADSFILFGGTILGGTINNSEYLGSSSGTLDGVTLQSGHGLTLYGGSVTIKDAFNYSQKDGNGNNTTTLAPDGGTLTFDNPNINGGGAVLDNAILDFGSAVYPAGSGVIATNGTSLTLGAGLVVLGTNASFGAGIGAGNDFTVDTPLFSDRGGNWQFYNQAAASDVLTNNSLIEADGTVSGSSATGNQSSRVGISGGQLVNNGTIEALNSGYVTVAPASYGKLGSIVSDGSYTNSSNGFSAPAEVILGGAGTINYNPATDSLKTSDTGNTGQSGVIELATTLDLGGATLDVAGIGAAQSFTLFGGTIQNGTLQNSQNLGFRDVFNDTSLSYFPSTLKNVTLTAGAGQPVLSIFRGGVYLAGNVNFAAGSTIGLQTLGDLGLNNVTINGSSAVNTLDNLTIHVEGPYIGTVAAMPGQTMTLGPNLTLALAPGAEGDFKADTITSSANLTADHDQVVSLLALHQDNLFQDQGTVTNDGFLHAANSTNTAAYPSQVNLSGQTVTNNGTLQGDGSGSAAAFVVVTADNFINAGSLVGNIKAVAASTGGLTFTNEGTNTVVSGATQTINGAYTQTGASALTQVDGGLTVSSGAGTVTVTGGRLEGTGTVTGNVNNTGGTVKPGDSPGTLTVTGNYTQGSGGTFLEELAGTGAGQFGVLSVGGTATLGGMLDISLVNGFAPTAGETFTFLTDAGQTGAFANADPSGHFFDGRGDSYAVTYNPTDTILSVVGVAAPEPSQWASFGLGLLGLTGLGWRARRRA